MLELSLAEKVAVWLLPILFAVTLHEAAHGYVAYKLGDDTAFLQGRISANPFKHIDLLGTIVIPLILMLTSPFIFGWAKPVPVDTRRLRHPARDTALVAAAGPLSNFLMAIGWAIIIKLGIWILRSKPQFQDIGVGLTLMGQAGIMINLTLAVLNMIPIPPLDGSRIVSYILPARAAMIYEKITPFGFVIVLLLIFAGILTAILGPAVGWLSQALLTVFQIK